MIANDSIISLLIMTKKKLWFLWYLDLDQHPNSNPFSAGKFIIIIIILIIIIIIITASLHSPVFLSPPSQQKHTQDVCEVPPPHCPKLFLRILQGDPQCHWSPPVRWNRRLIRRFFKGTPGWWLNQPIWKILVKMGILPNFRGENKNMFELPPPRHWWLNPFVNALFSEGKSCVDCPPQIPRLTMGGVVFERVHPCKDIIQQLSNNYNLNLQPKKI